MFSSYLHHFTSDFWKLPNFPIVKHSNFIGLTCKCEILMHCGHQKQRNLFQHEYLGLWALPKQQKQTSHFRI